MVLTAQQFEAIMPDATQLESDEPEINSCQQYIQLLLLVNCLEWLWQDRNDYFIGANVTVYYSRQQLKNRHFRGPDFFLVKKTQKRHRKSWVVWEENGKYPNLIIELLSNSTVKTDLSSKKELYQDNFRTPEYFWFDLETCEFKGFRLENNQYREIPPNDRGWRWSEELGLYLGVNADQLRYFTANRELVPTPQEAAIQEQSQVQQAKLPAQQAKLPAQQAKLQIKQANQRANHLAQRLRELGINLDRK